jgi:uncharacterized OB-fold protein
VTGGPGPVARNDATAEFFDATARGQFLLRRCRPHRHWNRPHSERCAECDSTDLEAEAASGRARLVSWVVLHPRPHPDGSTVPPTLPGIVELDEGPWGWTQIVGADPTELRDGQPLQVGFETPDGSEAVPVFTPVRTEG